MIFVDRYTALGIPDPDLATVCRGQCEGTGWIPIHFTGADPVLRAAWNEAHAASCTIDIAVPSDPPRLKTIQHGCDGWHFVKCAQCDGTGNAAQPLGTEEKGSNG